MQRLITVTFRMTARERQLLNLLAAYYERTPSDTLRRLVHEAAQQVQLTTPEGQEDVSEIAARAPPPVQC